MYIQVYLMHVIDEKLQRVGNDSVVNALFNLTGATMQIPIMTTFKNTPLSDCVESWVGKKVKTHAVEPQGKIIKLVSYENQGVIQAAAEGKHGVVWDTQYKWCLC